jgi:trehalose synthase-fused probable maltokinase
MPLIEIASRAIDCLTEKSVRAALEGEILPDYLAKQRWFASKDAAPGSIRIEGEIAVETDPRSLILIIRAGPSGQAADYQFSLTLLWDRPSDPKSIVADVVFETHKGWLVDAYSDDLFIRRLLTLPPLQHNELPAVGLRFTESFSPAALDGAAISRTGAEQSNTSLLIGPAILKAYRRLERGVHPEPEVGAFLTARGFKGTPPLLTTIELQYPGGETTTLGIVQRLVAGATDGWKYVAERLSRLCGSDACARAELQRFANRLGACTAGLHLALSGATDNPDFDPVAVSGGWFAEWSTTVGRSADKVFARLKQQERSGSEMRPGRQLQQVKDFIALWKVEAPTFDTIRIHGDYHLGQVLVTGDDVFVVDFEGEPMRPLVERRRRSTILRDVAGMLRSFDYALASDKTPGNASAGDVVAELKSVFLKSYLDSISSSSAFPAGIAEANAILMMGLLEKTLYEIQYELDNRPDWVGIPLRGLVDLIEISDGYSFKVAR